jgi:hypothetical protein
VATASVLIARARAHLRESTESFWSDAELLDHLNAGVRDLWRAIKDTYQDYFWAEATVTLAANASTLSGVPGDLATILGIEPSDPAAYPAVQFFERDFMSADFRAARAVPAVDPSFGGVFYYRATGAGAPPSTPTIHVAPRSTRTLTLRLVYSPTVPALTLAPDSTNPIPGESDHALVAWVVAYARAKEREDGSPDPNFLAVYATEKGNIVATLSPRTAEDPPEVDGVFDGEW